jgi:hypothetical protein
MKPVQTGQLMCSKTGQVYLLLTTLLSIVVVYIDTEQAKLMSANMI